MTNTLIFRVFGFFWERNNDKALTRTLNFLVLFEGSLVVPLFMLINILSINVFHNQPYEENAWLYLVGIPIAEFLILFHSTIVKKKMQRTKVREMLANYCKPRYRMPIWLILVLPFIFIFVVPIAINEDIASHIIKYFL